MLNYRGLGRQVKFEAEQVVLIVAHDALEAEIGQQEETADNIEKFFATVRRYTTESDKLNHTIVHKFIDNVIIHEPKQAWGELEPLHKAKKFRRCKQELPQRGGDYFSLTSFGPATAGCYRPRSGDFVV